MIVNLSSPDRSRDNLYLSNYATIQLRDELARLPGVGDITYLGQRDYSMRLWLDPKKMAKLNLTASDVIATIQQQNAQVAAGQIGQPPVPSGQVFQYTMTTLGRLVDVEQFAEMTIKTDAQGRIVRMRDVARIEMGAQGYDQTCTLDGKPSVALSIYQLPGTNALKTAKLVRDKMEELKQRFPEGLEYSIVYDTTPFINESINEVFITLIDAVLLVAFVVLLFLQNWRSAIIPLVAVPVAIIGTFAVMAAMGFSLNNLTLFGLVLAIGIVVDDAIVVVEAVEHHIETRPAAPRGHDQGHEPGLRAGHRRGPGPQRGLRALRVHQRHHRAVLPPVRPDDRRVDGDFGVQFADAQPGAFRPLAAAARRSRSSGGVLPLPASIRSWGRAGAIASSCPGPRISATPWPCRDGTRRQPASRSSWPWRWPPRGHVFLAAAWPLDRLLGFLFRRFNMGFARATEGYTRPVGRALRVSLLVLLVYGGLLYLTYWGFTNAPSGFIPMQDKGYLLVNMQLPDAASVERTEQVMRRIEKIARETKGVKHTVAIAGQSILLGANAPNFGAMYVMLNDFHERSARGLSGEEIAATLQASFQEEIDGRAGGRLRGPAGRRPGHGGRIQDHHRRPRRHRACRPAESGEKIVDQRPASRRPARPVQQLPRRHPLALPGHRPRPGQNHGRVDCRGVQHAPGLPRLAVRQRLQPVRPHLAGERPGRRPVSASRSTTSSSSRSATAPGTMVPLGAIASVRASAAR